MNILREHLDIFDGCRREDAVSEIEDVAGPAADAFQNVLGLIEHPPRRPEQQRRIGWAGSSVLNDSTAG
jgi:hypothetical protein